MHYMLVALLRVWHLQEKFNFHCTDQPFAEIRYDYVVQKSEEFKKRKKYHKVFQQSGW